MEQQRHPGLTAPSLYDLRNLFQINVEEGRHLWAMVYLLQKHFGRDGREEANALLERSSGNVDNPRILGAFNEKTPDWRRRTGASSARRNGRRRSTSGCRRRMISLLSPR